MPTLVLDLLKYVFLVILYIFIYRTVRAIYLELKPPRPAAPASSSPRQSSRKTRKAPKRATVIEGPLKGKTFELGDELIIGRADKCHIVLDDSYVSQIHARIFAKNDSYMIEDMGSTNGTYLNKRRIGGASELHRGDRVKIGKTVLEMRK